MASKKSQDNPKLNNGRKKRSDVSGWTGPQMAGAPLSSEEVAYLSLLATTIDATSLVVARLDSNGEIQFMNEGSRRLTGRRREYYIGKRIGDLTAHPRDILAGCEAMFQSVVKTGERLDYEFSVRRIDGTRHFLVTFIPEASEHENARSVTAIGQDISHHRETQESLRESDLRKDRFLAILGHELRNPLATLRSGLKLLEASVDPTRAATVRQMMERQLSHIIRLVNDLLDVSRIGRGRLSLVKRRIALADVVSVAVEASADSINNGQHLLHVKTPDEVVEFAGDFHRLVQVINNLLDNAAKYTPNGGEIELAAQRRDEVIEIRISDSGVGIPYEAQGNVFEVFTQLEQDHARLPGGLGIGLYLVKSIVEAHGGAVSVHSSGSGKGTTFTVSLPLA